MADNSSVTVVDHPADPPEQDQSVAVAAGAALANSADAQQDAQSAVTGSQIAQETATTAIAVADQAAQQANAATDTVFDNNSRITSLEEAIARMAEMHTQFLETAMTPPAPPEPPKPQKEDNPPGSTHWLQRQVFGKRKR